MIVGKKIIKKVQGHRILHFFNIARKIIDNVFALHIT